MGTMATCKGTAAVTLAATDEQILHRATSSTHRGDLVCKACTTPELVRRWWHAGTLGEMTVCRDRSSASAARGAAAMDRARASARSPSTASTARSSRTSGIVTTEVVRGHP